MQRKHEKENGVFVLRLASIDKGRSLQELGTRSPATKYGLGHRLAVASLAFCLNEI